MICPRVAIGLFLKCLVTSYIRAGHLNVPVSPKYKTFPGAEAGIGKKSKDDAGGSRARDPAPNDSWVSPVEHCPDLEGRQTLRSLPSPSPGSFSKVIWKMIAGGRSIIESSPGSVQVSANASAWPVGGDLNAAALSAPCAGAH